MVFLLGEFYKKESKSIFVSISNFLLSFFYLVSMAGEGRGISQDWEDYSQQKFQGNFYFKWLGKIVFQKGSLYLITWYHYIETAMVVKRP